MNALLATVLVCALSDPAPDLVNPPRSAQVLVPSQGFGMNGLLDLAGGAGPHPTLVLLHGFPGNEQNLDLAQAVNDQLAAETSDRLTSAPQEFSHPS